MFKNTSIWKYELKAEDFQSIKVPLGAQLLSCQTQRDAICAWFLVDIDEHARVEYDFFVFGTGNPASALHKYIEPMRFVSTVQMMNGRLVFHIFSNAPRVA